MTFLKLTELKREKNYFACLPFKKMNYQLIIGLPNVFIIRVLSLMNAFCKKQKDPLKPTDINTYIMQLQHWSVN